MNHGKINGLEYEQHNSKPEQEIEVSFTPEQKEAYQKALQEPEEFWSSQLKGTIKATTGLHIDVLPSPDDETEDWNEGSNDQSRERQAD